MPVSDIIDFERLFSSIPGPYLVVDRNKIIVAASDGYLRATGARREDMVGRSVPDDFFDPSHEDRSAAARDVAASFDRVIDLARPDTLPVLRLGGGRSPVAAKGPQAAAAARAWRSVNTPVLDAEGRVRWIIHALEDVTLAAPAASDLPALAPGQQARRSIVEELRWSNGVLSALPDTMFLQLVDHLSPVRIAEGDVLVEPLQPLNWVYFPLEGLNAAILHLADGSSAEIAMGGRGGLVGVSVLTGVTFEETETRARVPGSALRIRAGALRDILAANPQMRAELNWFVSMILTQVGLTSACNARHALDQRLARWLLTAGRHAETPRLPVSQDAIALALGVRRSGVSEALGRLHAQGLIATSRQSITLLDIPRLESQACDCFREGQLSRERYVDASAPERALPARIHSLIDRWAKLAAPSGGGQPG